MVYVISLYVFLVLQCVVVQAAEKPKYPLIELDTHQDIQRLRRIIDQLDKSPSPYIASTTTEPLPINTTGVLAAQNRPYVMDASAHLDMPANAKHFPGHQDTMSVSSVRPSRDQKSIVELASTARKVVSAKYTRGRHIGVDIVGHNERLSERAERYNAQWPSIRAMRQALAEPSIDRSKPRESEYLNSVEQQVMTTIFPPHGGLGYQHSDDAERQEALAQKRKEVAKCIEELREEYAHLPSYQQEQVIDAWRGGRAFGESRTLSNMGSTPNDPDYNKMPRDREHEEMMRKYNESY